MHSYWTWFDVDVASSLNAHLHYVADALEENSCLFVSYLDKPVEIPVHKRCYKAKSDVLSPLIRTSDVGRARLEEIKELLEAEGFVLQLRRSTKKKYLNQVTVPIPLDDPLFPLKIQKVLASIARILGEKMPLQVVVGYHQIRFTENLPGEIHYQSKAATLGFKIGKMIGSKLRTE